MVLSIHWNKCWASREGLTIRVHKPCLNLIGDYVGKLRDLEHTE